MYLEACEAYFQTIVEYQQYQCDLIRTHRMSDHTQVQFISELQKNILCISA